MSFETYHLKDVQKTCLKFNANFYLKLLKHSARFAPRFIIALAVVKLLFKFTFCFVLSILRGDLGDPNSFGSVRRELPSPTGKKGNKQLTKRALERKAPCI